MPKKTKKPRRTSRPQALRAKKVRPPVRGKKILIIEDERPLAHALELKFGHAGYDVEVAYTGTEGLDKARKGKFSLILLDLILPELDGFTVLKQLGRKRKVVVLSNLGQEEDKKRAADLGAVEYCIKANTPLSEIVKIVQSVL